MSVSRIGEVEFGAELPEVSPDTGLENVRRFAKAAGMLAPRFIDHEGAKQEGLPGAMVPGVMSQALLMAAIHRWAPTVELVKIDTVFRAMVLADHPHHLRGTVTDIDEDERTAEIDLTISNEAGETRVLGTATVRFPA